MWKPLPVSRFLIWVCVDLDIGSSEAQRRSIEKSLDL